MRGLSITTVLFAGISSVTMQLAPMRTSFPMVMPADDLCAGSDIHMLADNGSTALFAAAHGV